MKIDIDNIGLIENDHLLVKLKYYLNYELSASTLYFLSYAYGLTIYLSALAAIVFTPFMVYSLYQTKKYMWLILFFSLIVIPPPIIYFINIDKTYFMAFLYVELGIFYFYCFLLRFVAIEWVEEIKWRAVRKIQEEEARRNKQAFMQQFEKPIS